MGPESLKQVAGAGAARLLAVGVSKAREEEASDKERPPCLRHGFQEGAAGPAGTIKSSRSVPRLKEAESADSGTGRPLGGGAVSLCPAEKPRRDKASLDWHGLRPQGTGIPREQFKKPAPL